MDLEKIEQSLTKMYKGNSHRQIVFWYDDDQKFMNDISNIQLDGVKLIVLSEHNYFKTKYTLEVLDPYNDYLLYMPYRKPKPEDNPLLDTSIYAKSFYADYESILAEELHVDQHIKHELSRYSKYFDAKTRKQAFLKYNRTFKDIRQVELTIICAICKCDIIDFKEVLNSVLAQGIEDNIYIDEMNKYNVLDAFWYFVNKMFGYFEYTPSLSRMMMKFFVTIISSVSEVKLPDGLDDMVLDHYSEINVFVNNFRYNSNYKNAYNTISDEIAQNIDIKAVISQMKFEDIKTNDLFKEFDEAYIKHLITFGENQVNLDHIDDYLKERVNSYYYSEYVNDYKAIEYAYKIIKRINQFEKNVVDVTVKDYVSKYAYIDKYYDLYVYHYDHSHKEMFTNIDVLVENKYNNVYLDKLNQYWDTHLTRINSYDELDGKKQKQFSSDIVYNYARNAKTVVIISDAMRYEVGMQLNDYLKTDAKIKTDLKYMISSLPSYTELGMASLLPNLNMTVNDDYSITIGGQRTQGIPNRNAILQHNNQDAVAISYDDIKDVTGKKLTQFLKGVKLLYVYYNTIDARGDNAKTENEVFNAVHDSFGDLKLLITRLRDQCNFGQFLVTADHGFIYRRKPLDPSDKITVENKDQMYKKKRFIYSPLDLDIPGTHKLSMKYLSFKANMNAYFPKGGCIFATQGSGSNFVHGGASLQEIIIPLLEIKSTMRKVDTRPVEINLITSKYQVTSLYKKLDFIQVDPIGDTVLPQTFTVYFVDDQNKPISDQKIINANIQSKDIKDRTFELSFTLFNKAYDPSKKYYLIAKDDNGLEKYRHEFIIDIAFNDGFDFF